MRLTSRRMLIAATSAGFLDEVQPPLSRKRVAPIPSPQGVNRRRPVICLVPRWWLFPQDVNRPSVYHNFAYAISWLLTKRVAGCESPQDAMPIFWFQRSTAGCCLRRTMLISTADLNLVNKHSWRVCIDARTLTFVLVILEEDVESLLLNAMCLHSVLQCVVAYISMYCGKPNAQVTGNHGMTILLTE